MPFSDSLASRSARGLLPAIFARQLERGVAQLLARHHRLDARRAGSASARRDRLAGVEHAARVFCMPNMRIRCVAAPSAPRSISGRPKVASSEASTRSRRAGDADAAAEAVAVHRGDHRHRAVVDGGEGVVAAAVHRRRSACRRAPAPSCRRRPGSRGRRRGSRTHPHVVVAGRARRAGRASSRQPALPSAFTGGLSSTTSAMPPLVDVARRIAIASSLSAPSAALQRAARPRSTMRATSSAQLGRSSITPATVPLGR